ncbi:hypothetical protein FACS189490_06390 [Clostridia bacterium]|nr:hypothetical protein FACS189490_06390 [Clostridia bacterium]
MGLRLTTPPTSAAVTDFFGGKKRVSFNVWWLSGSNDIMLDYDTEGRLCSGAIYVRDIRSETCGLFGYSVVDTPNDNSEAEHYDYQGYIRVNDAKEALQVLLNITEKLSEQGCRFTEGTLENA